MKIMLKSSQMFLHETNGIVMGTARLGGQRKIDQNNGNTSKHVASTSFRRVNRKKHYFVTRTENFKPLMAI